MCNIEWLWKGQTALKGQTSNKNNSKNQSTKLEIKLFCGKFLKGKILPHFNLHFFISEQERCTALLYDSKSGQHFCCSVTQVIWIRMTRVKGGYLSIIYLQETEA